MLNCPCCAAMNSAIQLTAQAESRDLKPVARAYETDQVQQYGLGMY